MKIITPNQRTVNILTKAVANGFEFDEQDTIENTRINAEDFLIESEIDVTEEHVEVKSLGSHGQRVDWSDGKGFDFWSQGEIVDFSKHWFDSPETKVFHSTILDSDANVIRMYYLVGKTDYNQE
jgi:hypothetical protein